MGKEELVSHMVEKSGAKSALGGGGGGGTGGKGTLWNF